jgi:hypothetical protein
MNKLFITLAIYLFSLSLTAQHINTNKVLGTTFWEFAGTDLEVTDSTWIYVNSYQTTMFFNKQGELIMTLRPMDKYGKPMVENIKTFRFVASHYDTLSGIFKVTARSGRQYFMSRGFYLPKPTSVKKKL